MIKNIIFLFIVTLSQSQQSHSCTILDMSHYSNTSDLISLSWDLSSECTYWNFQTFKITVQHQKFLACNNKTNNSATTYKTDKQLITLKNLHPFLLYGIRTVLITGTITSDIETTLKISTPPSVPQFDQREVISTTMPWNRPSITLGYRFKIEYFFVWVILNQVTFDRVGNKTQINYYIQSWKYIPILIVRQNKP